MAAGASDMRITTGRRARLLLRNSDPSGDRQCSRHPGAGLACSSRISQVFCFALAGYALLGKSFAYLGLPIHPRTVARSDYPSKRPSGHGERQDSPIPLPDFPAAADVDQQIAPSGEARRVLPRANRVCSRE